MDSTILAYMLLGIGVYGIIGVGYAIYQKGSVNENITWFISGLLFGLMGLTVEVLYFKDKKKYTNKANTVNLINLFCILFAWLLISTLVLRVEYTTRLIIGFIAILIFHESYPFTRKK